MFDLGRPCAKCPFRKKQAPLYRLRPARLLEIINANAFQCHKTLDREEKEEGASLSDGRPQQCAGLMALLHDAGRPNQIMQVASRIAGFDAGKIIRDDTFDDIDECFRAHTGSPQAKGA